jgi:ATP-dependent Lon protease
MDALDQKLLAAFDGRIVRKDLLHGIKKGTNVPTFVLEFLLARFCASADPDEIQAGTEAVLALFRINGPLRLPCRSRKFVAARSLKLSLG